MTTTGDPAAPATGTDVTTEPTVETATVEKDWQAEYEKTLAHARKWEERAKANSSATKELEELRKQTMSDQEKAVAEAAAKARAEAFGEVGSKLVAAEIRAAAAGRNTDVDELVNGVNTSRFLDESGEPDREAITAWLDKVAPKPTEPEQKAPTIADIGQGNRGAPPALNSTQLESDLKRALGVS